jgi:FeS assembly SUF system protein
MSNQIITSSKKDLEKSVMTALSEVYDPEIPVNINELGLIYEIKINDDSSVFILMTMTAPNCPVAESLPVEVKDKVKSIPGVKDVQVEITWEPPWTPERMSEAAKLQLGMF